MAQDLTRQKIALIIDSAADLTPEQRERHHIYSIPLRVLYRDGEYRDGVDISPSQVYARLTEEVPTTSLPLPDDVLALYDQLAAEGYERAVHLCISSGLSGTYNMVSIVAAGRANPTVEVVDTKILSMGEGFMALECARKLEETGDIGQAIAHIQAVRSDMLGVFVIRTLEYLRKGGRIGLVESVLGNVLNLKPVIHVNDEGVYQAIAKARGFSAALDVLIQEVVRRYRDRPVRLAVVHGEARADAEALLDRARGALNVVEGFVAQVSPVLGVHTGPSLLGLVIYGARA